MATDNKTSVLVNSLLPEFLDTEGPKFQTFVKAYYEWMETTGQMTEQSKNILNNQDIDLAADEFLTYFKREILSDFPEDILADKRLVYKKIKDLYRSKGSEESYKLLFRILYNEELDFYYPGQDLLRASDGRWIQETSIRLTKPFRGNPDQLAGEITGRLSGAAAKVERVQKLTVDGVEVHEVFVTNVTGTFLDAEEIDNTANTISGTVISKSGSLQNVIITDGGSGHQRNDVLTITSASGTGGRGKVSITANGVISKLAVTNAGAGFLRTDPLILNNTTRAASNATGAGLLTAPISYSGRYTDVKGFLSWSNKLQDNRYFQEHSYVLRSSQVLNTYKEIVKNVVHPAGMRIFGDVLINVDIDNTTKPLQIESVLHLSDIISTDIFIPRVVSASIDQYESSGDDGAIVPRPELEIEQIETFFDIDIPEAGTGYQLEIELIAAQQSALLNADEIISVNLSRLIEGVTVNESANVAIIPIGRIWDPRVPSSNTSQYFANGNVWIREGGSYFTFENSGQILEQLAVGTTTFNPDINLNPLVTPQTIASTFAGFLNIELETFIDINTSISETAIGGVTSVDFEFDAFSEITDGTIPFSEYQINDFANLRIDPNYTNKPLNEEVTVPVVTEVSIDLGVSHLISSVVSIGSGLNIGTTTVELNIDPNSIVSTINVPSLQIDMDLGGASLISISSTTNIEANNEIYKEGSGFVTTVYVGDIDDVDTLTLAQFADVSVEALIGERRFISGEGTQFVTETSNTNPIMIRDSGNTNSLIYNQIESVYDANTMFLTSNVAITVVDGDIFYRN